MKFFLNYNKLNINLPILSLFFIIVFSSAKANTEKDFKDLTSKLRCMTCQNQTIYDSDAEFSIYIKKVIRQKLNEGKSQNEIKDFLIKRYGDYILFEPSFDRKNIFLWAFPFVVLLFSGIILTIRIKKNKVSK